MYDPQVYRIRVDGELRGSWSDYFRASSVRIEVGQDGLSSTTVISEPVDQAALLGICRCLSNLGLPVVAIDCLGQHAQADPSAGE
jgi:hypothetical protein